MGLIKNRRKSSRLDMASAMERVLKATIEQVAGQLKAQKAALEVLAREANWAVGSGGVYNWVGEDSPLGLAKKGLEIPKPKPKEAPK